MNFQSFGFLAFLLVTASACLTLARWDRRIAAECLTLACLIFYIIGGGWAALLVLAAGLAVSLTACGGDAGDGAGEGGMEGISLGDGPAAAGGSGASGDISAEAGNSADSGTAFGGTAGSSGLKFLCTVNEEGCHTQSGYYYIGLAANLFKPHGRTMAYGDGGVAGLMFLHHECGNGLAHDVAAAENNATRALGGHIVTCEKLENAGGSGAHEAGQTD